MCSAGNRSALRPNLVGPPCLSCPVIPCRLGRRLNFPGGPWHDLPSTLEMLNLNCVPCKKQRRDAPDAK
jgi:hypothetical protein